MSPVCLRLTPTNREEEHDEGRHSPLPWEPVIVTNGTHHNLWRALNLHTSRSRSRSVVDPLHRGKIKTFAISVFITECFRGQHSAATSVEQHSPFTAQELLVGWVTAPSLRVVWKKRCNETDSDDLVEFPLIIHPAASKPISNNYSNKRVCRGIHNNDPIITETEDIFLHKTKYEWESKGFCFRDRKLRAWMYFLVFGC